jgi:regulator of protease activity HflC (stomatin/prohibitin superfamily)
MGDFLRLILDSMEYMWPLRRVQQWERGGYYVMGRWVREIGPGVWPVVPWFCEVLAVSVVPAIVGTGRQDITLNDGSTLSFSATATCRVVDLFKALNKVDAFAETTQELLASVLADKLAAVDAARLQPERRARLFADLHRWVAEEALEYGIGVESVRFVSFITNVRTHRLIIDTSTIAEW